MVFNLLTNYLNLEISSKLAKFAAPLLRVVESENDEKLQKGLFKLDEWCKIFLTEVF